MTDLNFSLFLLTAVPEDTIINCLFRTVVWMSDHNFLRRYTSDILTDKNPGEPDPAVKKGKGSGFI